MSRSHVWRDRSPVVGTGSAGITLIEMMVVVAIVAVLIALAAPNLRAMYINNRLDAGANEFIAALNLARSEAIRRGQTVGIRRAGATSRDWTQGWEVYIETDPKGSAGYCQRNTAAGSGEDLLRVGQPLADQLSLWSTWAMRNCIVFSPDGRSDVPPIEPTPADDAFVLCYGGQIAESGRPRSRSIIVSSTGRVRVGVDTNNDGFTESDRGSPINHCTLVIQ